LSDEDAERLKSTGDDERLKSAEDGEIVAKENGKQDHDDDVIDGEDKLPVLTEKHETTEVCAHVYVCMHVCIGHTIECV